MRPFEQLYFGGELSDENAEALRVAAKAILGTQTKEDAVAATNLLSDAISNIGVDRMGRLLATAEKAQVTVGYTPSAIAALLWEILARLFRGLWTSPKTDKD